MLKLFNLSLIFYVVPFTILIINLYLLKVAILYHYFPHFYKLKQKEFID